MLPFRSAMFSAASGAAVISAFPYIVNVGAKADNGSAAVSISVPFPTGIQNGDIAFLHVSSNDNGGDAHSINTPAGWTLANQSSVDGLSFFKHALFWKRCNGSESGSVTVSRTGTYGTTDNLCGSIVTARGCIASGTPYEALDTHTATGTGMDDPGLTTLGDNRLVLDFACNSSPGSGTTTPAAGWTEVYDLLSTSGTNDTNWHLFSKEKATAGAVPVAQHIIVTSSNYHVIELALKPA